MNILLIVESPSKCRQIERLLGPPYQCIATCGHVRELTSLDQITDQYEPLYSTFRTAQKRKQLNHVKDAVRRIKDVDRIFLATDNDREGEKIAYCVAQLCGLPVDSVKRIVFNEITEPALTFALAHARPIYLNRVRAQEARQMLDLIMGYKISPMLWNHVQKSKQSKPIKQTKTNNQIKPMSAGRCQIPALRLIFDQHQHSEESTTTQVRGNFSSNFPSLVTFTQKVDDDDTTNMDYSGYIDMSFTVQSIKSSVRTVKPADPLNTCALIQLAETRLNMSAKETMQASQSLYESGHITYMRTDSVRINAQFMDSMTAHIRTRFGQEYEKKRKNVENCADSADEVEAHEAIRPTVHTLAQLNADSKDKEAQLYALIYKHTMQSCMADAVYDVVFVSLTASLTNSFSREWSRCSFDGWTRSNERSNERSDETEFQWARHLTPNSVLTCRQIVQCSSNKVPSLLTESSLIQKMREKQFGRPSTYAHIVQHIQDREYVKKTQKTKHIKIVHTITWDSLGKHESESKESVLQINRLHITPTGLRVIQFLIAHFEPLFAYSFTQTLESQLDQIELEQLSSSSLPSPSSSLSLRTRVVRQCDAQIMALVNKVNAVRSNAVSDTVTVHCGKYGLYAENNETGEKKAIVATSTKKQATILTVTANMATKALAKGDIVRTLSPDLTIRVGPRGHYLFYKTADMKKPIFKDVSKCPMDYSACDLTELMHWIHQTHGITY